MTKKLSTREKFLRGLKRGGYDVDERAKYWENKKKELEAQHAKYVEQGIIKPKTEEVAVNVVGGGNIAGLGIGNQGEPGVNPKKKKAVIPFKTFVRKKPE